MDQLLVTNARIDGCAASEIAISEGEIVGVGAGASEAFGSSEPTVLDAAGSLVLPSLVDGHCHPDKTTWGEPWVSRQSSSELAEFIARDVEIQLSMTTPVEERAGRLLERYVAHGARAIRAHIDVAPPYGLRNIEGVVAAGNNIAAALEVQIVAFPQLGLLSAPGTRELLRDAVGAGASLVGGIDPVGVENDLDGHLDAVFGLAELLQVGVDIHLHDRGEIGAQQVRAIADRTRSLSMEGLVTIGHAFCFADLEGDPFAQLAKETAAADISLATCALGADPVLPLEPLRDAGVRVVLGSDGIRDAWSPFGNANMVDRTHLLAYRTGAMTDEELADCFDVAAHAGADLVGLPPSRLRVGDPADFLVVNGQSVADVVVDRPVPDLVVRAGKVVARDGEYVGVG